MRPELKRKLLFLVLMLGASIARAQGSPLEVVFCQSGPSLPTGWAVSPAGLPVTCTSGGIGTLESGDNKLYNALFNDPERRLQTGRYMLTAAGAGGIINIKDTFNDQTFASRTRVVNLTGASAVVNSLEFLWDRATQPNGLIEVWGSSVKWLRLERQLDDVSARAPSPSIGSTCSGWTLPANVRCANQSSSSSNRVNTTTAAATASVTREFSLPAGRYRLSLTTRGAVKVQLSSGPDAANRYLVLDEDIANSSPSFAGSSRLFHASGQRVSLTISAVDAGTPFNFRGVSLVPHVETPPAAAVLAAERPSPWPAQGATAPGVPDLIALPPTDRTGAACARPNNRSSALADLRAWGADIARIDVPTVSRATRSGCKLLADADIYSDGTVNRAKFWAEAWPRILDETQRAVEAAASANIKAVLLLEPPTPTAKLDNSTAGWVNLQARSDFIRGVRELVARLSSPALRQSIWAYDLVNEPHEVRAGTGWGNLPASQWRILASELIAAVRQAETAAGVPIAAASWIVVPVGLFSSNDWAALYNQLVPFADKRVLYTEHYYDPFNFTHQNIPQPGQPSGVLPYTPAAAQVLGRLQPLADFTSRTGAPFYLGEFGSVVWAGWSPVSGVLSCAVCPCAPEPWQPRRDINGQPIYDNVNWLKDVMDAANTLGIAWTQHSFRTYEGWDSEYLAPNGPCQAVRHAPGQPDTPAMQLMKRYLSQ